MSHILLLTNSTGSSVDVLPALELLNHRVHILPAEPMPGRPIRAANVFFAGMPRKCGQPIPTQAAVTAATASSTSRLLYAPATIAASPATPTTPTVQDFTRFFPMRLFSMRLSPCGFRCGSPVNPALCGRFVSPKNASGAAKQCQRGGV